MARKIHPTAQVAAGAEIGEDVEIGPYAVIGAQVRIGDRTHIGPHVVIDGATALGVENYVVGQANLGGPPQDLSYKGEPTQLVIGDRNTIREFVTINRGTVKGGGITRVGSDCLLMACCHVAHDCELQDRVILANCVLLAGHVFVGFGAGLSGSCVAHHFATIGRYAFGGGMCRMATDVPPFMLAEGHPGRVRGVNVVGMRRAGFSEEDIDSLLHAFRAIYRSDTPRKHTLERLRADPMANKLVLEVVEFLENSEKGLKGRFRESLRAEFAREGAERILEHKTTP